MLEIMQFTGIDLFLIKQGEQVRMTEQRRFRRYKKDTVLELQYQGRLYKAKMIDYCLEGVAAVISSEVQIKEGDEVDIAVKSPQITTLGKVMWSNRDKSACKIGIKNTGQLKGCIEDFNVADTISGLRMSQKSGILTVELGDIIRKIYVRDGDMIFSSSSDDKEHLGEILVRDGKITHEKLQYLIQEIKQTQQRLGKVLISHGLITPNELWKEVRAQIEEIILKLFVLEEGTFIFDETLSFPTEEVIKLRLSTANLIYHGLKKIKNIKRIIHDLPSMESVLHFSSDPLELFQDIRLDSSGKKILSTIDNKSSIKEIIQITGIDDSEALKTIYSLLSSRLIAARDRGEAFDDVTKETIEEVLEKKIDPEVMEMIEKMYREHRKLGYYSALGVKDNALPAEVKSAYYRAAKKFHPDIHFYLNDESLKYKLSHIFSYIYEAYAVLSDPVKKAEYDKSLSIKPSKFSTKQDKAREYFEVGLYYFKKKKYADAELSFQKALYIDDFHADYHYYYGLTIITRNRYKDAKKSLERAIELDPFNADYVSELGKLFLKMGYPSRANALLNKAVRMSLDNRTFSHEKKNN